MMCLLAMVLQLFLQVQYFCYIYPSKRGQEALDLKIHPPQSPQEACHEDLPLSGWRLGVFFALPLLIVKTPTKSFGDVARTRRQQVGEPSIYRFRSGDDVLLQPEEESISLPSERTLASGESPTDPEKSPVLICAD